MSNYPTNKQKYWAGQAKYDAGLAEHPVSLPSIPPVLAIPPAPMPAPVVSVRPTQDNVLVWLKPRAATTSSGLVALPGNRQARGNGVREAVVLASGPGYRLRNGTGPLQPNETRPGMVVLVDERAGQDWSLDVSVPRHNPAGAEWLQDGAELRMVRESGEILSIVDDATPESPAREWQYGDLGRR